jgi:hypothetical protein
MAARQLSLWGGKRQRGRKLPPPDEFPVHCMIADTLRRWKQPGWIFWHTPNGGERPHRVNPKTGRSYSPEGSRLQRMGARKGVSDFVLVAPPHGRTFALELKREGEEPDEDQLAFGADVVAAGGEFAWVDNYKDAIAQLKAWGALPSSIRVQ